MHSYWLYKNKKLSDELEKKDFDINTLRNNQFLNKEQFEKLEETINLYKKENQFLKNENLDNKIINEKFKKMEEDYKILLLNNENLLLNNENLKSDYWKQVKKNNDLSLEIQNKIEELNKLN